MMRYLKASMTKMNLLRDLDPGPDSQEVTDEATSCRTFDVAQPLRL